MRPAIKPETKFFGIAVGEMCWVEMTPHLDGTPVYERGFYQGVIPYSEGIVAIVLMPWAQLSLEPLDKVYFVDPKNLTEEKPE